MEDDGGGGGTPAPPDYNEIPESALNVEVTDLVTFYLKLNELSGMGTAPVMTELNEMPMHIQDALTMTPGDAIKPLPEAVHAALLLKGRMSDFAHFVSDVTEGLQNIGAAAAVVAEVYSGADGENAASMESILFAFNDPRADRPEGFRPGKELESMYDLRQSQLPLAQDPNATTTDVKYENGWAIYTFSDGSVRKEQTGSGGYGSPEVKTVEVYGPGNTLISSTTTNNQILHDGTSRKTVTTTNHDQDGGSTSSDVVTSTRQDGTITVDTTNTTTTPDGKETTTNNTITADPNNNTAGDDDEGQAGPVEEAEERYDTQGNEDVKEDLGIGY